MSTTLEAIELKIVAKETEVERVKKQLEDAIGDRDREVLLRQELAALQQQLAALQQQLAALQQQLAALQQKEVLLMQQQAGAAGSQRSWQPTQLLFKQACSNHGEQHSLAVSSATACTHNMPLCFHYITLLSLSHCITSHNVWGVFMLQAFLFYPAECLGCVPFLHVLFMAPTRLLFWFLQQQQVSHACACKAAKHAWPATVCTAAAKIYALAVLVSKSFACSTTWRMVATCLQLSRISEASEVQIHVKDLAAASCVAASCCTTLHSTCCMQERHALCAHVDFCVHLALPKDNTRVPHHHPAQCCMHTVSLIACNTDVCPALPCLAAAPAPASSSAIPRWPVLHHNSTR
jgi:hypothetical protein